MRIINVRLEREEMSHVEWSKNIGHRPRQLELELY